MLFSEFLFNALKQYYNYVVKRKSSGFVISEIKEIDDVGVFGDYFLVYFFFELIKGVNKYTVNLKDIFKELIFSCIIFLKLRMGNLRVLLILLSSVFYNFYYFENNLFVI